MATIDKSLPNTKTEIEIPGEEVLIGAQEETIENEKGKETDITMEEDGSATVNFDPKAATPEGGEDHFENLAEFLGDNVLDPLASELMDKYKDYKQSRQEWEEGYREGLNLLGFKYITRTEPFRGASSVTHPVLAEAVTHYPNTPNLSLIHISEPTRPY